jgi:hypothetical protein
MTTTTIIINSTPYQPPPDDPHTVQTNNDHCTHCHRLSFSECPECHLAICQHHSFINPNPTQPPLCPECLRVARLEIAADNLGRAIASMMLVGGKHGQN